MSDMLRDELITDPLGRDYSGMDDKAAASDLNTSYRVRNRNSISGDEIFHNVASRVDWDGLTDTQRMQFLAFCGRDVIDPFARANVELVKSIFGNSSATVGNLNAVRFENITRAVELGLGVVKVGHVAVARTV